MLLNGARIHGIELPLADIFASEDEQAVVNAILGDLHETSRDDIQSDMHLARDFFQSNDHLFRLALRLSISLCRPIIVANLLSLRTLSPAKLGDELSCAHRILHCTDLNAAQRAKYQAIIDLLIAHGNTAQLNHIERRIEGVARLVEERESKYSTLAERVDKLLSLLDRSEIMPPKEKHISDQP